MKVVVGMSGGVDSSVAALKMIEAGHDVEGVFLRLWDPLAGKGSRCCSLEDLEDARKVAAELGIPLREECTSRRFFDEIFMASLEAYAGGLTPNPCVVCNEKIKFVELARVADDLGADLLVSGHYARNEEGRDGRRHLFRGADRSKDQSYFLHRLDQERLARTLFPVGGMTKSEAREIASAAGLPVANKAESQELCFVPEGTSYAQLLEAWLPDRVRPGAIVDREGRSLGEHGGVHRYTVGQRRGLGVAAGVPLYVRELRAGTGTVVVSEEKEMMVHRFEVRDDTWIAGDPPSEAFDGLVQVRSRHRGVEARIRRSGDRLEVLPAQPIRRPAPGQAAVFYLDDEVLGGGWIV